MKFVPFGRPSLNVWQIAVGTENLSICSGYGADAATSSATPRAFSP